MSMGDKIHFLRVDLGLTLQELGDKVGVSASTVRKWETGYIKTLRTDKLHQFDRWSNPSNGSYCLAVWLRTGGPLRG